MSGPTGNSSTAKINGRSLRAFFCGMFGWGCWLGFEAGSLMLGFFAVIFGAGAVFHGSIALFQKVKAIGGLTRWSRFQRGNAKPKADPIAGEDAMRARGLIK